MISQYLLVTYDPTEAVKALTVEEVAWGYIQVSLILILRPFLFLASFSFLPFSLPFLSSLLSLV